MTRYVVQITRTYEVQADDEDLAQVEALAEDESEDRQPPTFIVTGLDLERGPHQPSGES